MTEREALLASAPLRVLFLTESFHPVLGGGETHIRRVGSALAAGGDVATVVTRRGRPDWLAEDCIDEVRIIRVAPSGRARRGKYLMALPALLATVREASRHDVVVVRGTRVLGLPGLIAARLTGRALVLQPEINGEFSGEAFLWGQPVARFWPLRLAILAAVRLRNRLLRDADGFVAMSRAIQNEAQASGFALDRIHLMPHGVDTRRFAPVPPSEKRALRTAKGLAADSVVFTFTGRLLRGKGLETLLEAFALVAARNGGAHLVLVGAGEAQALSVEESLRERAMRPDLAGRVLFAGRVDDVESWLQASDVFVFPSEYEALGISLVEAAACGLPCLGSRTGGIVDVIEDGASGCLLPVGEGQVWAEAMLAIAADPQRRESWGRRGREIALSRFDAVESVAAYRALFRELRDRVRAR